MLLSLDNDGNFTYKCHQPQRHADPTNTEMLSAHVSHPDVQYVQPDMVALPPCPHCAELGIHSQMFIHVNLTDEERANVDPIMGEVEGVKYVKHAQTGEDVPVKVKVKRPVAPHPSLALHDAFPQHMANHGKHPPKQQ